MSWIYACASTIGNYHIEHDIPCQDYSNFVMDESKKFGVAVVCDGAGSLKHSHLGATFLGKQAIANFQEYFSQDVKQINIINSKQWRKIAFEQFKEVDKKLYAYAKSEGITYASLGSTIILLVFSESTLLVTHIGDGRGAYKSPNHGWLPLFQPHKGENANETVFFTSNLWKQSLDAAYFDTSVVRDEFTAFTILSDGCENACFEHYIKDEKTGKYHDPNRPYTPFLDPNIPVLLKVHQQGIHQDLINENWKKFLVQGNPVLKKEGDDKSMILCVKTPLKT